MTRRAVVMGCIAVAAIVVTVLVARSGGDPADERRADVISTTTAVTTPATVSDSAPAVTDLVPTSSAPLADDRRARDVVAAASPHLALTDLQQECLVDRLAGMPEVLADVAPAPGGGGFDRLVAEGQRCVVQVDFAPAFVDGLADALTTDPTDEQRQCLAIAFVELDEAQRLSILQAGLEPQGSSAEDGRDVLRSLVEGCGLGL